MAYIGTPFADNTNLLNTTVSSTGAGTGIDVSGFSTLLVQVSGSTFNGIITFERSLDNVYWSPALVTELNALNQKTQIETAGLYFIRTEAQFIRYNVTNISGSATIVIDGSQNVVSNADKVAWAMDETNNTPDAIARNIMYGQIYLQPARAAEFIIIDFNILPTGAAFSQ